MPDLQKAIIIGAGPAGLAAAIRLRQQNQLNPVVYELRSSSAPALGGSLGIPANGLRLLDRMGVYDSVIQRGAECFKQTFRWTTGAIFKEVDFLAEPKSSTGYGYARINRPELVNILRELAQDLGIPVHWEKRMSSVEEKSDGVVVTFTDGTTDTGDILLGCDGIHSAVRSLYVDPSIRPEYSGISALSDIVDVVNPEDNQTAMHATITAQGMVASVPSTSTKTFWFISKEVPLPDADLLDDRNNWAEHRQKEVMEFRSSLSSVLDNIRGPWGDHLRQCVDASQHVAFYPHYGLPTGGRWFIPSAEARGGHCRVLLIGDAGHAMVPHAGQGVSLLLEDIFLLSGLLAKHQAGSIESLEGVFGKYEEVRRPRIDAIHAIAENNSKMRKNATSWGIWKKEWHMWFTMLMNRLPGMGSTALNHGDVVYDIEDELKYI